MGLLKFFATTKKSSSYISPLTVSNLIPKSSASVVICVVKTPTLRVTLWTGISTWTRFGNTDTPEGFMSLVLTK